ncbi:helix-turn-helix transcriptional regulator [Aurantibacter aestuarii]|uniref:HTH luxR-type domain-containing protein n=1 Tax=Aurantibacter aestuarii TaxID=1266046 RepID=A0A2T1NC55_9FLAO|nr:hypothetical protein [Aurantibacter aestuarii]PSG90022.1 hypothetical protein C7H52_01760 [Aurantibacter aestuarii]
MIFRYLFFIFLFFFKISYSQDRYNNVEAYTKALRKYHTNPLYFKNTVDSVLNLVNDSLKFSPNSRLKKSKPELLDFSAYLNRKSINYQESLEKLNESIKIQQEISDEFWLSRTYRSISGIWFSQDAFDKADFFFKLAAENANSQKNIEELLKLKSFKMYQESNRILKLKDETKIDSINKVSISIYEDVVEEALNHKLYSIAASAYDELARVYRYFKNLKQSESYLKKAKQYYALDSNLIGLEKVQYAYSKLYRKLGQYKQSKIFLDESINFVKLLGDSTKLKMRYLSQVHLAEAQKNYKNAYEYYIKYKRLNDDIVAKENYQNMADLSARLEFENKLAQEKIRLENDLNLEILDSKSKTRLYTWLTILISFFLLILSYFIFRQKELKSKNIAQKKIIENSKLKEDLNNKTIKVSELLAETLSQITQKETLIETIKNTDELSSNKNVKSLITNLKAEDKQSKTYQNIKSDNFKIYSDFSKFLRNKYNDLTVTDVEILIYLAQDLKDKEIAQLRNTTPESVRKSRYRISKKLNLNKTANLKDFVLETYKSLKTNS